MIRVYLDWNVLAQMKAGDHNELLHILSNDDRFHKIYSTAHIGDLYAGYTGDEAQNQFIEADLDFITKITNNWCASTDNSQVVVDKRDPKELFEDRIRPVSPFGSFGFSSEINTPAIIEQVAKGRESLMAISLSDILKESYKDEKNAEKINKWYPELKDNQTMGGMIESMIGQFRRMNESNEYKDMRQVLQDSLLVNRDRMFDCSDPIGEIETIYSKLGRPPYLKDFTHVPKWYGEILNWYLLLDMHGYQEDRVNVKKGRKETFKNTTNDAFHAAFASTCDFYIVNDKKSFKKTSAVYKKLELNTLVMKPNQFIDHFNKFLSFETAADDFHTMVGIFKREPDQVLEDEHSTLKCFYFPYFLFNIFTRAHVSYDKESGATMFFLSKDKPTNGKWTFQIEIKKLVNTLNSIFGEDVNKFGSYDPQKEDFAHEWRGRKWDFDMVNFRLAFPNGWLQLYIDFKPEISSNDVS